MGFLDFFGRKNSASALAKHAKRAADKRAQNPDRWASLQALGDIGTAEAVSALLQRFTIRVDPSITDQDEKELAMRGVIAAGDEAIEPLKEFLRETQSIAWPVKMLDQLVSEEELVSTLVGVLEEMHTDYERDPQRKVDTIAQLEERMDDRVVPAVTRFLEDASESARFHAAATVLAQENAAESKDALVEAYLRDESVRVKVQVLDGFIQREWTLDGRGEEMAKDLPSGYAINGDTLSKNR